MRSRRGHSGVPEVDPKCCTPLAIRYECKTHISIIRDLQTVAGPSFTEDRSKEAPVIAEGDQHVSSLRRIHWIVQLPGASGVTTGAPKRVSYTHPKQVLMQFTYFDLKIAQDRGLKSFHNGGFAIIFEKYHADRNIGKSAEIPQKTIRRHQFNSMRYHLKSEVTGTRGPVQQ